MTIDLFVSDEQDHIVMDLERWSALAQAALREEGVRGSVEVSLIFSDEPTIADLNERFMGKSGPTDVLSFPIDDEPLYSGRFPDSGGTGPGEPIAPVIPQLVGDIVICPSVAERNAVDHEVSFEDEIALLVVHGVLHLLGWDHMEDDEAERMEAREQEILKRHYRLRIVK
jgi:probable rRNA maturation factor